jgi:hypothetical protein
MPTARNVTTSLAIACLAAIATLAHAAEPELAVSLTSGRQFRGTIDRTSTADQLVLRTENGGITLRRPILWERIVRATIDAQPADVATVRQQAIDRRSQEPGVRNQRSSTGGERSLLRKIELRGEPPAEDTAAEEELPPPRVAMVVFDPYIANWDADVETDGVVIDVAPLDLNRQLIPIGGTLEVELFAPQRRTLDLAPQSGGDTLELVERWTRAITPADFGPSGARLRLPFGAITPELQPHWTASHYGLVHVRLAIPGHGVFEDSRDGVRIRPWAPNRDRLQQKTGQRFLPTENLGRRD